MTVYIGTSGYGHPDWQGLFYPKELTRSQWLEYYSQHFNSVEIEATFFGLPASPVFRHWRLRTPKDFHFFLKGSRQITHHERLRDCHDLLAEFFQRASELQEKLAGVLWQLPPKFGHDVELLEEFLGEMERVQVVYGKVRQAFEFGDISWFREEVYEILERFGVAIAIADGLFNLQINNGEPVTEKARGEYDVRPLIDVPPTADFFYLRRHGPADVIGAAYTRQELEALARELQPLLTDRDSYIFFTNDRNASATGNGQELQKLLFS